MNSAPLHLDAAAIRIDGLDDVRIEPPPRHKLPPSAEHHVIDRPVRTEPAAS